MGLFLRLGNEKNRRDLVTLIFLQALAEIGPLTTQPGDRYGIF